MAQATDQLALQTRDTKILDMHTIIQGYTYCGQGGLCVPSGTLPKLLITFVRDSTRERESRANPRDCVSSRRNAANRTISREIPTVRVRAVWREILENARDSTR